MPERHTRRLIPAVLFIAVTRLIPSAAEPPPLPEGAVARFGPDRFYHPIDVQRSALSPDGSTLAVHLWIPDRSEIAIWDVDSGELKGTVPLPPSQRELMALLFAPDGSVLWNEGVHLRRWTAETGARTISDRLALFFPQFTFSPDGKWLTVVDHRREILCVSWPDGELRFETTIADIPNTVTTVAAAYSRDGRRLRVALRNGELHELDAATGRPLGKPLELPGPFVVKGRSGVFASNDLAFSADGERVLDISREGSSVISWQPGEDATVETGPELKGLEVFRSSGVKFSDRLIACPQLQGLRVFDAETGRLIRHLTSAPNRGTEFTIGGRRVSLCRGGRVARVWDADTDVILPSAGPNYGVRHVKFFDGGDTLATLAGTMEWHVRMTPSGEVLSQGDEVPRRYGGYPEAPGGAADVDSAVREIDRRFHDFGDRFRQELTLEVPTSAYEKPFKVGRWPSSLSADGRLLLTTRRFTPTRRHRNLPPAEKRRVSPAGRGETLRVFDLVTGQILHSREVPRIGSWIALSPDGNRIAATRDHPAGVFVWDTAADRPPLPLTGFDNDTVGLQFSPDGHAVFGYVAAEVPRSRDLRRNRLRLVEVVSGQPRTSTLQVPEEDVNAVTFAPDHRRLLLAGESGRLHVMDALTGELLATLDGHAGAIRAIDVTPDGRWAATGSDDCSVILWDLARIPAPPLEGSATKFWEDLASADAAAAYRGICGLAERPEAALELIRSRSEAITCPSADEIHESIAQLGAASFQKREAATMELARHLTFTADLLRAALDDDPTPEARRRIEFLLRQSEDSITFRVMRTIELLERIGSPEALAILERIEVRLPGTSFGREASRSLARLRGR